MCHFITATLPAGSKPKIVGEIADRFGLAWDPIQNRNLQQSLRPGEMYFMTTFGGCDCGTRLGSKNRPEDADRAKTSLEPRIAKLRKKGWSEEKILRWRESQERELQRAEKNSNDAQIWLDFIRAAIEANATPSVGVLLHWYKCDIQDEPIDLARRQWIDIRDASIEHFLNIAENTLYEFGAGPKRK